MFRTSAISFVIAMIFSSMIGTSFLDKGYHLRGGIGRWGEGNLCFSSVIAFSYKVNNLSSMMDMSVLASTYPQSLCLPSGRANMLRIFPACRRCCWRQPLRKAFVLRWGTPTCSGFSGFAGIIVGVDLSAMPLPSVGARQHGVDFSG